jgi:phosphatidylglycerophosphatase A
VGILLVAVLDRLPLAPVWAWTSRGLLVLGLFFLGVWAASGAERFLGRVDPAPVVIDEVMGQVLEMAAGRVLALPGL